MLVPREDRAGVKARVVYEGPIEAPIAAGQKLGALEVDVPGHDARVASTSSPAPTCRAAGS